ncbi:MAG: hypothetical protein K2M89_00065 [Clostridiales bacterium]|nr:hypothetical protein [Clostridiales bacterium]
MVNNFAVKCNICGCKIRFRYQVSEEMCPISFLCPNCKTHINGDLQTIWHYGKESVEERPWHYNLNLNNACEIKYEDGEYVLELSSDFLTKKMSKNSGVYIPSPFIRSLSIGKDNQNSRFYNFLSAWTEKWNEIKINLDLCHNEKYDILLSRFTKSYDFFPNDINAIMTTHQQLVYFCHKILPKSTLREYTKMNKNIIKLLAKQSQEFKNFISIFDLEYVKDAERKLLHLIKLFLDMYPKFLPIFNSLKLDNVDDCGISTLSFEDIKSFYQDSYELILAVLPEIIGLNNISRRRCLNNFVCGTHDFNAKINSYSSKYMLYQELLDRNDIFSWIITDRIQNHLRNSIGHFNYEEDPVEQTITFTDKHKDKVSKFSKSLIEVARDCIYMFYTLINLLEVNYSLLKILTIDAKA